MNQNSTNEINDILNMIGDKEQERQYCIPVHTTNGRSIRGGQVMPRNKKCPCGSGLKYKDCGKESRCI